jgi:hypothetical protein
MKSLRDGLPPEVAQQIHPDWQRHETAYWDVRDTGLLHSRDQWIAFAHGRVLVSGTSAVEVLHAAQASGLHPFVTCVGRGHAPARMRRAVCAYDTPSPQEALPVIPVEFRTHEGVPGLVYEQGIPDTGADASALPWADGVQWALNPRQGVPGLRGGVGATSASTLVCALWAFLDGQTSPCRLQADCTGHERILGRDVRNRLDVLFRGPHQEVVLNP